MADHASPLSKNISSVLRDASRAHVMEAFDLRGVWNLRNINPILMMEVNITRQVTPTTHMVMDLPLHPRGVLR